MHLAEVNGKQRGTFPKPVSGYNGHKHTAGLQPAVDMLQEQPFHALGSLLPDLEIVRRVQVDQGKRFHGALHVEAISVDHFLRDQPGLFRSVGVEFDPIAVN
jgi:hypothetical protein